MLEVLVEERKDIQNRIQKKLDEKLYEEELNPQK